MEANTADMHKKVTEKHWILISWLIFLHYVLDFASIFVNISSKCRSAWLPYNRLLGLKANFHVRYFWKKKFLRLQPMSIGGRHTFKQCSFWYPFQKKFPKTISWRDDTVCYDQCKQPLPPGRSRIHGAMPEQYPLYLPEELALAETSFSIRNVMLFALVALLSYQTNTTNGICTNYKFSP